MLIQSGEVHVWNASLNVAVWRVTAYQGLLSPDERERANRYIAAKHRVRFTVGRGMLREVLSRYTGSPPHQLEFSYGPQGKPSLKDGVPNFNIAHSEDQLLIAVTMRQPVGIDIEQVRSIPDMEQISQRFLPALDEREQNMIDMIDQETAFFLRWTRTEALLKATGIGIPALEQQEQPDLTEWTICQIDAPNGFIAALAVQGEISQIRRMEL